MLTSILALTLLFMGFMGLDETFEFLKIFIVHEYVMILATIEKFRQFVLLFQFAVHFVYMIYF